MISDYSGRLGAQPGRSRRSRTRTTHKSSRRRLTRRSIDRAVAADTTAAAENGVDGGHK